MGAHPLADAYNLANTTPNMLYDIVLGGVLSATFIPVFVDHLATRSEREAFGGPSRRCSAVSVVVLVAMTVVWPWLLAPEVIRALTALDHTAQRPQVDGARPRSGRWPGPACSAGSSSRSPSTGSSPWPAALLNTRRRFVAADGRAPIANNVVCIAVLVWFGSWSGPTAGLLGRGQAHRGQLVLLGLGTTAGVVLQGLAAAAQPSGCPTSRGCGWRWDPPRCRLRTVVRLGGWTFGFVVANQVAVFVVCPAVGTARAPTQFLAYTYAYTFLQMPYGMVAVP